MILKYVVKLDSIRYIFEDSRVFAGLMINSTQLNLLVSYMC